MKEKWSQLIGMVIVLAASGGVYWLLRGTPPVETESETDIETVVPVEVGHIERRTLHAYVRAYGSLVPDPGTAGSAPGDLPVTSRLEGQITEVLCELGQQVQQGQPLFRLDDRKARLAQEAAEQALTLARTNLARQEKLKAVEGTSDKRLEEARQQVDQADNQVMQTRVALALHQVSAPGDGRVLAVQARVGQTVTPGEVLAMLVDPNKLVVRAEVPSAETAALRPGQVVEVRPSGAANGADSALSGNVLYVDSQVNPDSGTVTVLVRLADQGRLRSGQFVKCLIAVAEHPDCLVVPVESVVLTPEGESVVALVQGEEAITTPVQPGLTEGAWVEVSGQGLREGLSIVTVGAYGLPGRTKIRVMEE